MTSRQKRISEILNQAFAPVLLEVVDNSHLHVGHAGSSDDGETHFTIKIASPILANMNRVDAHRAINNELGSEFDAGLHALSIKLAPCSPAQT